ncbi:CHAT domain-containing protein [Trichothermofontia sp.]
MSISEVPCLSIAIAPLQNLGGGHFAIWVMQAPYPGGYVHQDRAWTDALNQIWQAWQEMFSLQRLDHPSADPLPSATPLPLAAGEWPLAPQAGSYSGRLMQHLGTALWQWLFDGVVQQSLSQSQGIAIGQGKPLRLRLEIRDPELIALPWEIMQAEIGKQAISLNQQVLFSRTTTDVDPLVTPTHRSLLRILLVLGQPEAGDRSALALEEEAASIRKVLTLAGTEAINNSEVMPAPCRVDVLLQPTPAALISQLETGSYNVFFYAGHGVPGPDGGVLFLGSDTLSGTELAQVLTRCQVSLAVFNACWGALPDRLKPELAAAGVLGDLPITTAATPTGEIVSPLRQGPPAFARSSLAEVLIHHGVPAVLAMRDSIADPEALSFIRAFAQALAERLPIDAAVAVARQHLLTLYKFNQPAWTLPVLYLHPEFDGCLLGPPDEGVTELPGDVPVHACLRSLEAQPRVWSIGTGRIRVGRAEGKGNDLIIPEQWVSQNHAEIFCRHTGVGEAAKPDYFLRDFSRYGTYVLTAGDWQRVHNQEVHLQSGVQIKFGSSQGQALEFIIERPDLA